MNETLGRVLPPLVLGLAGELVGAIDDGVRARGFTDLRPAHGFAFARIAPDGATVNEIADHLGVTKQAASQMVEELVRKGYVERRPHPADARARLVVLTDRGRACTRAADLAAADAVRPWAEALGEAGLERLAGDLTALAALGPGGRLRPVW